MSSKKNAVLKDLEAVKFITFSSVTPTGKVIYAFLAQKNIHPEILHEYDNIELVKSAVMLGLGCAFLPKNTIIRERKERALEIVPLAGLEIKRPLGILYPEGKIFTKTTRTFYEMLAN